MIGFQLLKPPEQIQFPFLLKSPVIPCIKRPIEVTVAQEKLDDRGQAQEKLAPSSDHQTQHAHSDFSLNPFLSNLS